MLRCFSFSLIWLSMKRKRLLQSPEMVSDSMLSRQLVCTTYPTRQQKYSYIFSLLRFCR